MTLVLRFCFYNNNQLRCLLQWCIYLCLLIYANVYSLLIGQKTYWKDHRDIYTNLLEWYKISVIASDREKTGQISNNLSKDIQEFLVTMVE